MTSGILNTDPGPHEGWTLGVALIPRPADGDDAAIVDTRMLTRDEYLALDDAEKVLSNFNAARLLGALQDATLKFDDAAQGALSDDLFALSDTGTVLDIQGALAAVMTGFTSFRSNFERAARTLGQPAANITRDLFEHLHRHNPDYRLAWQLRNLDQHHISPVNLLHVAYLNDTDAEDVPPRLVLDLEEVFRTIESLSIPQRYRTQWTELQEMWADESQKVDLREVIAHAYFACQTVTASLVLEFEGALVERIELLAGIHAEVIDQGKPLLSRPAHRELGDVREVRMLDLRVFEGAMATVNGAREALGHVPRYDIGDGLSGEATLRYVTLRPASDT